MLLSLYTWLKGSSCIHVSISIKQHLLQACIQIDKRATAWQVTLLCLLSDNLPKMTAAIRNADIISDMQVLLCYAGLCNFVHYCAALCSAALCHAVMHAAKLWLPCAAM